MTWLILFCRFLIVPASAWHSIESNFASIYTFVCASVNIHKSIYPSVHLEIKANFSQTVRAGSRSSIRCASAWYVDGCGFDPQVRQNILSLRFGHEKISTAILSLPLIQEG